MLRWWLSRAVIRSTSDETVRSIEIFPFHLHRINEFVSVDNAVGGMPTFYSTKAFRMNNRIQRKTSSKISLVYSSVRLRSIDGDLFLWQEFLSRWSKSTNAAVGSTKRSKAEHQVPAQPNSFQSRILPLHETTSAKQRTSDRQLLSTTASSSWGTTDGENTIHECNTLSTFSLDLASRVRFDRT